MLYLHVFGSNLQYDAREKANRRGELGPNPQLSAVSRTRLATTTDGELGERVRQLDDTTRFGLARDEASLLRTASELLDKTSEELALKAASAPSRGRPIPLAPLARPVGSASGHLARDPNRPLPPTRIPRLSALLN